MKVLIVFLVLCVGGFCESIGVYPRYVRPGDIVFIQLTGSDVFDSHPILYGDKGNTQICQKTKFILQWACQIPTISALGDQYIYSNIRDNNDAGRLQYIEVTVVGSTRIGLITESIKSDISAKESGKFINTSTFRLLNRKNRTPGLVFLPEIRNIPVININKSISELKSNPLKTWIPTTYGYTSLPDVCRKAISQIDLSDQGVNFLAAADPGISPTTEPRIGYSGELIHETTTNEEAAKFNQSILSSIKMPIAAARTKATNIVRVFVIDTMDNNRYDPFKMKFPDNFEIKGHGSVIYSLIKTISGLPDNAMSAYAACDASGKCSIPIIINGLCNAMKYKIENPKAITIVNLSLSSPDGGSLLKEAIEQTIRSGVIIVAANGNRSNCNGKSLSQGQNCHSFPADWSTSILPTGSSGQIISVGALRYAYTQGKASISGIALYDRSSLPANIKNQYAMYYAPGQLYQLNSKANTATLISGTSISAAYFTGALGYFAGRYPVFPVCLTGGSYVNVNNTQLKTLSLANMKCVKSDTK